MPVNYQQGEDVPVKRNFKKDGSQGGDGKPWRIIDLANKAGGEPSQRSGPGPRKRKGKLPVKQVFNGLINLLLIFGIGMAAYFGWAFYKNNYDDKGFLNDGDKAETATDGAEQDPQKDLQERVDEVKNLLGVDGENGEATSTEPEVTKNMLKISDNSVGYLNIRNESSTSGDIIGRATPGEEYEYLSIESNWYNIVIESGGGWVHGDYIEVIEESATGDTRVSDDSATSTEDVEESRLKITNTPTGDLNVRSSPWGALIGKVYPGEEYAYTDTKDNWYFISIINADTGEDESGWVFGDYINQL